jgi:Lipid A 3-O-deacylase (PagL)
MRARVAGLLLLVFAVLFAARAGQGQQLIADADAAGRSQVEVAQMANAFSSSSDPIAAPRFEAPIGMEASAGDEPKPKQRPAQEVIVEGLMSYGNYKIFASGYDEKLFTAGVEYDRHSWGYFLKAQVDYVAEILPFVLLDKPLKTDIYGNPVPQKQKGIREYVPGFGISPIGFRLQWRSNKAIKPYMEAKGGMIGFTKKVPSTEATYENFSLQSATGVQVKMSDRWGLRLGLFSDFHFSNDFIVPVDPGLDVMNANIGVSYHF